MESIQDLLDRLNAIDESTTIEAKRGGAIHKSVMETVCAFSNEPGLGGGYILLGVERLESTLFPEYTVTGIQDADKLQLDLATQCASVFNQAIRPLVEIEKFNDEKLVMKIWVAELPDAQKPLYFKHEGLPSGAYRRIGSSDQRCTGDDLYVFYNHEDSLDSSLVKDTTLEDISEEALNLYRKLREKVNAGAEELLYDDIDLLLSLGCIRKENNVWRLTYCGLLVFGKKQALRRILPMVRVDYIRIPGNEWVSDPENRFSTIDMRGPLIELVQRTFNAISDDLPRGFLLLENELQAESVGLPAKVLREAIVNSFIHRTYRENQPIQILRYSNRIEIINPGFSLKPEDQLGEPGSKNRNPFIAAIFHETNLAETKGSGIRIMRRLMNQAKMVPPTFESDHSANQFSARLLLHHFLNEGDIAWLRTFKDFQLNDAQKIGLVFMRETGALDNSVYRQINGCDILKASVELRSLRDMDILVQKGKGRSTYYIPGKYFQTSTLASTSFGQEMNSHSMGIKSEGTLPDYPESLPDNLKSLSDNLESLPDNLKKKIENLGRRVKEKEQMNALILDLCQWQPLTLRQLSLIIRRNEKYLFQYITPLKTEGKLEYTIPDMPNHPDQAYKTVIN